MISHSGLFLLSRVIATDCECPLSASAIALSLGAGAVANEARDPSVRVAEIEIDPVQLEASKEAAKEIVEVRLVPGGLFLSASACRSLRTRKGRVLSLVLACPWVLMGNTPGRPACFSRASG